MGGFWVKESVRRKECGNIGEILGIGIYGEGDRG